MVLLCEEDLVLSAGNEARTREMEFAARNVASVTGEVGAYSVQEYEHILSFGDVGAEARGDWMTVREDAMSVPEGGTEKAGVKDGLEEDGDGQLCGLHFETARHV